MTYRILVTEPIKQSVIQKLSDRYTVDVAKRGDFNTEEQLAEVINDYDALLCMLSTPVTSRVIDAARKLKVIANHAVGYNNIDIEAAHKAGIKVANTPGVLTESSADFTMALLLATTRRVCEAQQYLKEGKFDGWEPLGFMGMELNGSTLGILGMGRIGTAVARRARAFGMNILYHNRSKVTEELENELGAQYTTNIRELAEKSDILSLNCPLTEDTYHAVDADILSAMPDHALLINTSRGPVIDEAALASALHKQIIAGAGLDVFEDEPEIHPELLSAPNCVLTPHIASATHQTRTAIGMLAADAIIGVLEDEPEYAIPHLIKV